MRNLRRTLYGLAALLLVGLAVGLSFGQNQAPPAGKSVATLTRYSMMLAANGLRVSVYPKDPLHPFDSTDWHVEIPITVTAVQYFKDRQELLVSVDYNWRKSDEEALLAQLAWKYKEVGKPVAPEAITITPLEVVGHSLLVRDGDKDYLLFATDKLAKLTAQTAAFRVPMVAGAERLHERLSTMPEAVQLVLRAGYRFDRIAGLTVDRRALNTAWGNVLESVKPNKATKAEMLLVDRDVEQLLRRKLATEVATVIKSYGLTPAEEAEVLKLALAQIEKLTLLSAPLTVKELLELGEESLAVTAKGIQLEAKPAMNEEAITKLKESRSFSEKLSQVAESISDIANNSSIDDRKFHSMARKLVLDAGASANYKIIFSAKVNMHLDKSENEITDNHLKEIKQARTYVSNKSAYSRDVQESYSREIEGPMKKIESTAKLLNLRRVSAAALAAMANQGWSAVRVTGSDVVFIDTPVALKATPIPVEGDVVAALVKQLRELQAELERVGRRAIKMDSFQAMVTGPDAPPGGFPVRPGAEGGSLGRVQQIKSASKICQVFAVPISEVHATIRLVPLYRNMKNHSHVPWGEKRGLQWVKAADGMSTPALADNEYVLYGEGIGDKGILYQVIILYVEE